VGLNVDLKLFCT